MGSWTTQPEARTAEPGVPISEVPRPPSPSTPRAHVPLAEPLGPGVMTEGLSTSQLPRPSRLSTAGTPASLLCPPILPCLPPSPLSWRSPAQPPKTEAEQTDTVPARLWAGLSCWFGSWQVPCGNLGCLGGMSFYPHLTDKEVEAGEPATRLRPGDRSWDMSPTLQPSPRDRVWTLRPPGPI